jgi:hypothetical protein
MNLGAVLVLGALAAKFMDVAPTTTAPTREKLEGRLKFGFGL